MLAFGAAYHHGGLDLQRRRRAQRHRPARGRRHAGLCGRGPGTVDGAQRWDGHTKTGMQSYGNMLRLRHADYNGLALQTRYAHLSRLCVAAGDTVKAGQLIGYSGESGNCCGAHLHFEVLWRRRARAPAELAGR